MLAAKFAGNRPMVWPLTFIASTTYLLIGLLAGAGRTRYGMFTASALFCCWLGDMIGPGHFVWGLYAFFAAHILLMAAFWTTDVNWKQCTYAAPVLALIGILNVLWIFPHVPEGERAAVVAYTLVISAMVVTAWGARRNNPWLLPAAIVFFVSDIFVARWRYGGGAINGYLCYPLYYVSCVLFAISIRSAAEEKD